MFTCASSPSISELSEVKEGIVTTKAEKAWTLLGGQGCAGAGEVSTYEEQGGEILYKVW